MQISSWLDQQSSFPELVVNKELNIEQTLADSTYLGPHENKHGARIDKFRRQIADASLLRPIGSTLAEMYEEPVLTVSLFWTSIFYSNLGKNDDVFTNIFYWIFISLE